MQQTQVVCGWRIFPQTLGPCLRVYPLTSSFCSRGNDLIPPWRSSSPLPLSLSLSFHFPATAWVPDYATSLRQQTTVCWVLKHNFPTAKSAFNITDTIFWVHRNIWRLSYKMCLQEECIFLTYRADGVDGPPEIERN